MSSEILFTHQLQKHRLKDQSWDLRIDIDSLKKNKKHTQNYEFQI